MGSGTSSSMVNKISIFDARTTDWKISSDEYSNNQRSIIHIKNVNCLCSSFWDAKKDDECQEDYTTVVSRLGSESLEGEVYLLKINENKVVCKILPILEESDIDKNNNEIIIAKKASELVIKGESPYFPIVYHSTLCDTTLFSKKSKFYNKALLYSIKTHITKEMTRIERKRFMISSRGITIDELIQKYNINLNDIKISSYLLFNELAWGDLGTFAKKKLISEKSQRWNGIILQILFAIKDMHNKLNIVHRDLHQGNILIRLLKDKINILIHDFGKSSFRLIWSQEDKKIDYIILLESLEKIVTDDTIINKIKKLSSFIEREIQPTNIKNSYEDQVIEEWKNIIASK